LSVEPTWVNVATSNCTILDGLCHVTANMFWNVKSMRRFTTPLSAAAKEITDTRVIVAAPQLTLTIWPVWLDEPVPT
jgi:hypothetical protein